MSRRERKSGNDIAKGVGIGLALASAGYLAYQFFKGTKEEKEIST